MAKHPASSGAPEEAGCFAMSAEYQSAGVTYVTMLSAPSREVAPV